MSEQSCIRAQFKHSVAKANHSKSSNDGSMNRSAFTLDVDLTLPLTGVTAIFGHSGSGKTTLLRCIAGLTQAESGYLAVDQAIWQQAKRFLKPHQRPIGYVFQEPSLFPHLTARGNINYAIKRASSNHADFSIAKIQKILGIEHLLDRYPNELSGGEQQRIAIARALSIQPKLLLMDEPLASLDQARKKEILPYLERLKTDLDIPILYVSHSMDEVVRLADHAVVMEQGKATAQGSLKEVFSKLSLSGLEGEDIGVILEGKITGTDSQWHLNRFEFNKGLLWIRDGVKDNLTQESSATQQTVVKTARVRVLAKDISLARSNHEDSSILNRLAVEVADHKDDEDPSMSLVKLKAGNAFLIARITRKSFHQLALKPGDKVWAQIKSVALVR